MWRWLSCHCPFQRPDPHPGFGEPDGERRAPRSRRGLRYGLPGIGRAHDEQRSPSAARSQQLGARVADRADQLDEAQQRTVGDRGVKVELSGEHLPEQVGQLRGRAALNRDRDLRRELVQPGDRKRVVDRPRR